MLNVNYSAKFKKDLKLMEKRKLNMLKIFNIMHDIKNETPLKPKHNEHKLSGEYEGCLECHIEPDWLLVYQKEGQDLYFIRTGSHSDLF